MEPTASEEFPILFGYVVGVSIRLFYYFIYIIDYWINWFLIIKYAFGPPLLFNGFYTRLKWIGYRICNNALNSSAKERETWEDTLREFSVVPYTDQCHYYTLQ